MTYNVFDGTLNLAQSQSLYVVISTKIMPVLHKL